MPENRLRSLTWLGGGTPKAIADIEESVGYNAAGGEPETLRLTAQKFKRRAVFQPDEVEPLFALLADAGVKLIVVHQLLGYPAAFAAPRHAVAFVHDFYAACPRATLLAAPAISAWQATLNRIKQNQPNSKMLNNRKTLRFLKFFSPFSAF